VTRDNHLKLHLAIALTLACSATEVLGERGNDGSQVRTSSRTVVGMVTRTFTDESRKNWYGTGPRPLTTAIWYPATARTGETETIFAERPLATKTQFFTSITVADCRFLRRAAKLKMIGLFFSCRDEKPYLLVSFRMNCPDLSLVRM